MKKQITRLIASILAGAMVMSGLPQLPAKAEESYTETYAYDLETMKEQILNSEAAESYSNGAVTFAGNSTAVNVGNELVYHLFRQGNTDKEQTVTLVTQDITAGYGDDYELKVDGEILDGKANILLNGEGVTYDVYLGEDVLADSGSEEDGESEADSDQAVDMDEVKENASCTFDITFEPGEQVKEIRIRAKMPETAVGNKEFQFIICECQDGLETGENSTTAVNIIETREIEAAEVALVEGSEEVVDGYVTVLVERTGNTNGYTTYNLTSTDETAVNGEDFVLKSTQLMFSPGVSLQRVHIPLVSAASEEDKTFTLRTDDSEMEVDYRTTTSGAAATTFTAQRNLVDISMAEFTWGEVTSAVDDDSLVFYEESDSERYKFGFRSVVGGGNKRNASIRTSEKYDFTGIESVRFSASYGVGTIAGDHLEVYVSNEDYATNEGMLANLNGIGGRYSIYDLTGQGMHEFSVSRTGEYYLYMTAEQHSASGWIYYYLYNQEFDGGDEGHVALVKKAYTLQTVAPKSTEAGSVASDVKLTLSSDSSVTGDKVTAYRDESFQITYNLWDEEAVYAGYELVDSQYNVYHTEYNTSPTFTLTSDILEKYSGKFTDNTIMIRPIFEQKQATVKILAQDFTKLSEANLLSANIDTENGVAVYKDGETEIATITWEPDYPMHADLTFTITENADYDGEYHFTAFGVASGSSSSTLGNIIYHSPINNEWSITLENAYFEITPMFSNKNAQLLLNVTGATHGSFIGEPEDNTADSYTVYELDGKYNANDVVTFLAKPDDGYRAKWSYRDVATGDTKEYYGTTFYYRVQVPMLLTDNNVSLEFIECDTKKSYSIVANVTMQGGDLLHEPAADSEIYSALSGAKVSIEGITKETAEDGNAGTFTIEALPGETYTAMVFANNRQYIQDVDIPDDNTSSVLQSMKLSYYYEGPRVTDVKYYSYDGSVQRGDSIYLSDEADSVILAVEIEKAGQDVTDVIYKLKDSEGNPRGTEFVGGRNGSEYLWSAQLGLIAAEGDQIWVELVNRTYDEDGNVTDQVSYGEVNTGYTIVIADYTATSYIPSTGVDQDIESVPVFGSMYCMLSKWGMKFPTVTVSKTGGIIYMTIGVAPGGMYNFYHAEDQNGFKPLNTWTGYKNMVQSSLQTLTDYWSGSIDKTATQTLKKKMFSMTFNISAQLALYNITNEETGNSELVVVGSWMTFGISGTFTYNIPFFLGYLPMFAAMTFSANFADTVQLTSKDPEGYVALQSMHDPTKSSYKSENDLNFTVSFQGTVGVGVNGVADLAGGVKGNLIFDWVNLSWGTIKLNAQGVFTVELLIFGGTGSINIGTREILNTNPYTQNLTADAVDETEKSILDDELTTFTMRPLESYDQKINASSTAGLRTAIANSDTLISDAYNFSRPQIYSMGNDKYLMVATVDGEHVSGLDSVNSEEGEESVGSEDVAVLSYTIYDAANGTYTTDEDGKLFKSLEPVGSEIGKSVNFHPSVTEIGDTGKYLITWNSILYGNDLENMDFANSRPVIKAAVYDSNTDSVVAYKSLVTEDDDNNLMANTVLDTAYDEENQEMIVLYRSMNLTGLSENSKLIDYATVGSTLFCTSLKLDDNKEVTFTDSTEVVTGGKSDGEYHIIKTADLEIMNGTPIVTYQMTQGEQANLISTGEDGSTNHIYVASLAYGDSGYALSNQGEITEGISDGYNANPQLASYESDGKTYNILMWKQENRMATVDPLEFLNGGDTLMGVEPDENGGTAVEPTYSGEGTATIPSKTAGSMGDYQIFQGEDGKVYSIWTEGTDSGTKVMMATLESVDGSSVSWGVGSKVFETTNNEYVRAMSPIVDGDGTLHLLYRESLIDGGSDGYSEVVMKNVDLTGNQLVVENYTGFTDEEIAEDFSELTNIKLNVSNLYPTAGETLTIRGRVKNESVQASKAQTLALYANGVDTGERVTIPALNSGIEDEFSFSYTVPDDYDGTPIEFSVSGAKGTVLRQSTVSGSALQVAEMETEQLTYLESTENEDGTVEYTGTVSYEVIATIQNDGNDVSEEGTFVLSHLEHGKDSEGNDVVNETVFATCDVPAIMPGETEKISFVVEVPATYFGENVFHLASVAGAVYTNYDPDNVENQVMDAPFTDYVQALEAPVASTLTVARSKSIGVGQEMLLNAIVSPSTAQATAGLTFESSDSTIASVDKNGVIIGVKEGTCTITVTTKNGIQKTVTIQVTKEAASEDDEVYDPDDKPGTGDNSGGSTDGTDENGNGSTNGQKDNSKTGDNSPILPLAILLVVSGALIVAITVVKRKKNK